MSVINQNLLLTPEGYQISRSVRLRSSATATLTRTFPSQGNTTKWTYSLWMKQSLATEMFLLGANYNSGTGIGLGIGNNKLWYTVNGVGNAYSTAVFRDPSAWCHIVFMFDSAQATITNRMRAFFNGVEHSFSAALITTQGGSYDVNKAVSHAVGSIQGIRNSFDGYLTEVNFIDGQALTPFSFGETDAVTGVWKPKKYAGTYGTNGFYLNFSDNSAATAAAIGKDSSGNGNNWTPNNISVTAGVTYDSMLDVPTMYADGGNGRGNYAVLNPLAWRTTYSNTVPTNGNLTCTSADNSRFFTATMAEIDKTYFELTATTVSGSGVSAVIWQSENPQSGAVSALSYISATGVVSVLGTTVFTGATFTSGDVIGLAHDSAAGTVAVYKNGTLQGTATGLPTSINLYAGCTVGISSVVNANFGQRPFAYTPPTGFKALNTQNLPDATIKKGGSYFNAVTYTGNGAARSITGAGFQPDFVWIKNRSSGSFWHQLYDSVRGALKSLFSNDTSSESTYTDTLTAFASDGFTLGTDAAFNGGVNKSGDSYVAWQWKESASAGFDIVTYTGNGTNGQTVSHSLGVKPAMMIVKLRNGADNWTVYHQSMGATKGIQLNQTAALQTLPGYWNNTEPTSSAFTLGTYSVANGSTFVAYLFSEVAGFSKFGSYTGNGSADGPFAYLGFRPRFVMIKRTDSTGNWQIIDTARVQYNEDNAALYPNLSNAEDLTNTKLDALSNGFKIRGTPSTDFNTSGSTYVFAAFAENPFKNSLAR